MVVSARGPSSVSKILGSPATLRNAHRDNLVGELARVPGGHGALVAAQGVLVLLLARNFILAGQVLRRLDHAAGDGAEPLVRRDGDAGAGQAVVEGHRAEPGAPARLVAVELRAAHALRAAGDDHVGVLRLDQHGGVEDGLQAGGAAAIQLVAGHLDGQPAFSPASRPMAGFSPEG